MLILLKVRKDIFKINSILILANKKISEKKILFSLFFT